MQCSYEVSEADYLKAWKLRCKGVSRQTTPKLIMFWVFVLVCLMVLWVVVSKSSRSAAPAIDNHQAAADEDSEPAPAATHAPVAKTLFWDVGPFVILGGVWFFMIFRMLPGRRLRKLYRNDPAVQGRYTVEITSDGFALENTAGLTTRTRWNIYEYWSEHDDLMVLVLRSQAYFILVLSQLAPDQREELRRLLGAALAKR
jgi:hypothetical protein